MKRHRSDEAPAQPNGKVLMAIIASMMIAQARAHNPINPEEHQVDWWMIGGIMLMLLDSVRALQCLYQALTMLSEWIKFSPSTASGHEDVLVAKGVIEKPEVDQPRHGSDSEDDGDDGSTPLADVGPASSGMSRRLDLRGDALSMLPRSGSRTDDPTSSRTSRRSGLQRDAATLMPRSGSPLDDPT